MPHRYAEIAFTPTVKEAQERLGSRRSYARMESDPEITHQRLGDAEAEFISGRDSFYMATVSDTGWPYIQHRGGPAGFVRVIDDITIGFADFRGNRQYVSVGNLTHDDRVSLFFMDYAGRMRLKLFGHATIVDPKDGETLSHLALPGYRGRVERGILVRVEGYDWNCPQHITERVALDEVRAKVASLTARIAELEAELARRPAPQSGK